MENTKDPSTPAPAIGKIGPYTVFLTPPTPKPTSEIPPSSPETPKKVAVNCPPPVQPPPAKFEPAGDRFAFLWDAVSKVQDGTVFTFSFMILYLTSLLLVHLCVHLFLTFLVLFFMQNN